jgi:MYXO-CTERM domain-containing protein
MTSMSLMGQTTGLIAQGWELVKSADLEGTKMLSVSDAAPSSWWIVSAYFGDSAGSLNMHDDFFKLLTVSGCLGTFVNGQCTTGGTGNSVPVPGTLALAGLGLAGFAWRRRAAAAR